MRRWTDAELSQAATQNSSIEGVLRTLRLVPAGGNYRSVRLHASRLGIALPVWKQKPPTKEVRPTEDIFRVNSRIGSSKLRHYIVSRNLLPYRCVGCANDGWHCGKVLVLQVDHINGVRDDNRLENLRFMCPNCHSQTETFAGRANRRPKPTPQKMPRRPRRPTVDSRKVSYELLAARYALLKNYTRVAAEFKVSDTTVRKAVLCTPTSSNDRLQGFDP